MILTQRSEPVMQGDHFHGSEQKELAHPDQLKLMITGPGEEIILFEGPPEGEKWTAVISVLVKKELI